MLLSLNSFHFDLQSFAVHQFVRVFVTMCVVLGHGFGEQKSRLLSSGVHYLGLRMWRVSQPDQLDHFHFHFLFRLFSIVCGDLTVLVYHIMFVMKIERQTYKRVENLRIN